MSVLEAITDSNHIFYLNECQNSFSPFSTTKVIDMR